MRRIPLRAVRLLPLLASPIDGEALTACRALAKTLAAVGLDLNDMAAAVAIAPEPQRHQTSAPSSYFDLCRAVRDLDGGRLSHAERQFVLTMCRLGDQRPSPRQAAWLTDLHVRLSARCAA